MLKEIGRQFDIGASGVSQTSRRIAMKISQENKLNKKIRKTENKLNLLRMKIYPVKFLSSETMCFLLFHRDRSDGKADFTWT